MSDVRNQYTVTFDLAGRAMSYEVIGDARYGANEVLLDRDDNLLQLQAWEAQGYSVAPFLFQDIRQKIQTGISQLVFSAVHQVTGKSPENFKLKDYHTFVNDQQHLELCKLLYETDVKNFPVDFQKVTDRVSELCGISLSVKNPISKNKFFCLRIVRPGSNDNNPLHKDIWIDSYRNAVNTYIPIAMSNEYSSLPLVTGSHHWPESDVQRTYGVAQVNGVSYHVPAIVATKPPLQLTIPNPKEDEILVFSPYLIHGSARNSTDFTRVSLETRFWRDSL